jgi:hypothetical protein
MINFYKFGTLGEIYNDHKVNIFDIQTYEKIDASPEARTPNSNLSNIFSHDLEKTDFFHLAKKSNPYKPRGAKNFSEIEKVNNYLKTCHQNKMLPVPLSQNIVFQNELISPGKAVAISDYI